MWLRSLSSRTVLGGGQVRQLACRAFRLREDGDFGFPTAGDGTEQCSEQRHTDTRQPSGSAVVSPPDSRHDILLRLFFMKSIMMY